MSWEWFFSALAVSHVVGTLTFFFIALANLAIYNKEWRKNMTKGYVLGLLLQSNKWLLVWHSGLKLYLWGPKDKE